MQQCEATTKANARKSSEVASDENPGSQEQSRHLRRRLGAQDRRIQRRETAILGTASRGCRPRTQRHEPVLTVLTPGLVRQRLDAFGPPRHLEPRREVSLNECRRFLAAEGNFGNRLESVSRRTGVSYRRVQDVVRAFLRETP